MRTAGDQWKGELRGGRRPENTHSTCPCAGGATVSCAPRSAPGQGGGLWPRAPSCKSRRLSLKHCLQVLAAKRQLAGTVKVRNPTVATPLRDAETLKSRAGARTVLRTASIVALRTRMIARRQRMVAWSNTGHWCLYGRPTERTDVSISFAGTFEAR